VFATFETEEGISRAAIYNDLVNHNNSDLPSYYK
jgi:hypothetical protein